MRVDPYHHLICGKCGEEEFFQPLYDYPTFLVGGICLKCGNTYYRRGQNRYPFVLIEKILIKKEVPKMQTGEADTRTDLPSAKSVPRRDLSKNILTFLEVHAAGATVSDIAVSVGAGKNSTVGVALARLAGLEKVYREGHFWKLTTAKTEVGKDVLEKRKSVETAKATEPTKGPYIVFTRAGIVEIDGKERQTFYGRSYDSLDEVGIDIENGLIMSSVLLVKRIAISQKVIFTE